jgi:hypothetical protein
MHEGGASEARRLKMAKSKLEKYGFTRATVSLDINGRGEFSHSYLVLQGEADWSERLTIVFQRDNLMYDRYLSANRVMETREAARLAPRLDVGAVPFGVHYGARMESLDASALSLARIAKTVAAIEAAGSFSNPDALACWIEKLEGLGLTVRYQYGTCEEYRDVPEDRRGRAGRWAYGADACRLVAQMEEERAASASS